MAFPSSQRFFSKAMCAGKYVAAITLQKLVQFLNFNPCLFAQPWQKKMVYIISL